MSDRIKIEKAAGTWTVRAGGAILGESDGALLLHEDGHDEVVYFPRVDIAMEFLDRSEKTTQCPLKGEAAYFSIMSESAKIDDAAWSYESPKDDVSEIAGYIAFHTEDVTVERI
ncbi:DUF427 domain-containing protein [Palleronia sp. LCG004]|uniref:DUF427 domain-containing protein n=1 Tax=Palleronia sp. LCG004 TaxID=3079304 RepID=UPI002942607A|nr:DUF427 domain-containing protein [Palleronia sp. LCG004]WOI55311.1 DUF427 domain-containing protein [Palleronia sp. LCG004]